MPAPTVPSIPSFMRAWTYSQAGLTSSVLKYSQEVPVPEIKKDGDEVLVRVSYCALNVGSSFLMQLIPTFKFLRTVPAIPEFDFSGTVISSSIDDLHPGVSVFGMVTAGRQLATGAGALAEYV